MDFHCFGTPSTKYTANKPGVNLPRRICGIDRCHKYIYYIYIYVYVYIFFFKKNDLLFHACKTESRSENNKCMPLRVSIPEYTESIYLSNSKQGRGMF